MSEIDEFRHYQGQRMRDLDGPSTRGMALKVLELNKECAENLHAAHMWQAVAQRALAGRRRLTVLERLGYVATGVLGYMLVNWLSGGRL